MLNCFEVFLVTLIMSLNANPQGEVQPKFCPLLEICIEIKIKFPQEIGAQILLSPVNMS